MTSESSSAPELNGNRTIIVPQDRLLSAYAAAIAPAIGAAFAFGNLMTSPTHPHLTHDEIQLLALMCIPFLAWALFVLHRAVSRIDIDDAHISALSLLGTRKSLPLRDITSSAILVGGEEKKFLAVGTAGGIQLKIPTLSFPEAELAALRDDIARRVRIATARDIPTRPPEAESWRVCLFAVLLPVMMLIVIKLAQMFSIIGR